MDEILVTFITSLDVIFLLFFKYSNISLSVLFKSSSDSKDEIKDTPYFSFML